MNLITSILYFSKLFGCVTGVYEYEYTEYAENPEEIKPVSTGAKIEDYIVGASATESHKLPFVLGFNFQVYLKSLNIL